jgi:hypothetical protein
MLKDLTPGDEVKVTHIDRPARPTFDLFAIITRIRGCRRTIPQPG